METALDKTIDRLNYDCYFEVLVLVKYAKSLEEMQFFDSGDMGALRSSKQNRVLDV